LPRLLRPGGVALLELGIAQAPRVEPLFQGLTVVRVAPDLAGIPRVLVLQAPK
jgi:release factor glutamine methyltransferase